MRTELEFVLVHGASHGAWCWEDVGSRLAARGHRVVALDLPGHGRRAAEARRASVAAYAHAVADTMAREALSRAILVGHSMAGVVIPKVAELAPARVARLVFLAAVALPSGSSLAETHFPPAVRAMVRGLAAARGDGTYHFAAEHAWSRYLGDLPRGHPAVVRALALLTPQPVRPVFERVDLSRFYAMAVPRDYVCCRSDVAVPPARAAVYAARLGVRPVALDTAHDPMVSAPDALARLLEKLAG